MKREDPARMARTGDAALACAVMALDPEGFQGVVLRGAGGPVRDKWIESFRNLVRGRRIIRIPPHVAVDRLTGGIDVAATLKAGRPCHDRGLLADADGQVLLLSSAERLSPDKAALIAATLDTREAPSADEIRPARLTFIACDEGIEDDEALPVILRERAAFLIGIADCDAPELPEIGMDAARALLPQVALPDTIAEALCATALAFGIASLRPAVFSLKAARAIAALDGRRIVAEEDAAAAARLVLAPRATRFPAPPEQEDAETPADSQSTEQPDEGEDTAQPSPQELSELLIAAVKASLPPGLLAALEQGLMQREAAKSGAGALTNQTGVKRGRPAGTRAGRPRNGARLSLIETLRAAAPWQPLRRKAAPLRKGVLVSPEDFRIARYKQKRETTAIFVVDASGSAAIHRMAEAKGAVELVLADCYVRRDRTALIAFRGKTAEVLLPPTRSLQRAKKSLADLPGGGGTPLCAAIESALTVAAQVRRGGGTPLVVFLTDGRANIARDGTADRVKALADAEAAARALRHSGTRAMMIDLSDNRGGPARKLAEAMAARYLPLPHADAGRISGAVGAAMKAN